MTWESAIWKEGVFFKLVCLVLKSYMPVLWLLWSNTGSMSVYECILCCRWNKELAFHTVLSGLCACLGRPNAHNQRPMPIFSPFRHTVNALNLCHFKWKNNKVRLSVSARADWFSPATLSEADADIGSRFHWYKKDMGNKFERRPWIRPSMWMHHWNNVGVMLVSMTAALEMTWAE